MIGLDPAGAIQVVQQQVLFKRKFESQQFQRIIIQILFKRQLQSQQLEWVLIKVLFREFRIQFQQGHEQQFPQ